MMTGGIQIAKIAFPTNFNENALKASITKEINYFIFQWQLRKIYFIDNLGQKC